MAIDFSFNLNQITKNNNKINVICVLTMSLSTCSLEFKKELIKI